VEILVVISEEYENKQLYYGQALIVLCQKLLSGLPIFNGEVRFSSFF